MFLNLYFVCSISMAILKNKTVFKNYTCSNYIATLSCIQVPLPDLNVIKLTQALCRSCVGQWHCYLGGIKRQQQRPAVGEEDLHSIISELPPALVNLLYLLIRPGEGGRFRLSMRTLVKGHIVNL